MSVLEKYARRNQKEETKVTSIRLPMSMHEDFQSYCEGLGLSISEGIQYLIKEEMDKITSAHTTVTTKVVPRETPQPKRTTTKEKQSVFRLQPFANDQDQIYCPICEEWKNRKQYKDHARRTHNMTSEELIHSDLDKVNSMLNQ